MVKLKPERLKEKKVPMVGRESFVCVLLVCKPADCVSMDCAPDCEPVDCAPSLPAASTARKSTPIAFRTHISSYLV